MQAKSKRIHVIVGILTGCFAIAFVLYLRQTHYQQMIRPTVMHIDHVLHEFQRHVYKQAQENPDFQLPQTIPNSFLGQAYSDEHNGNEKSQVTLADPYDTNRRGNVSLLEGYAQSEHLNGGGPNFRFNGNKYKYRRLTPSLGIVYSFGPDQDDDLGAVTTEALTAAAGAYSERDNSNSLAAYTYSYNYGGTGELDGDVLTVLNLQDARQTTSSMEAK